jgi:hypothetical protein
LAFLAAVALAIPAAASDALVIQHEAVQCLVAGKYPRLDACFEPSSRVARARVYFRPEGGGDWYYVEMTPEDPCFRGVLPRPKKTLKHVSYYLAVTDRDFAEARTEEYRPVVAPDEKSCPIGSPAPFLTSGERRGRHSRRVRGRWPPRRRRDGGLGRGRDGGGGGDGGGRDRRGRRGGASVHDPAPRRRDHDHDDHAPGGPHHHHNNQHHQHHNHLDDHDYAPDGHAPHPDDDHDHHPPHTDHPDDNHDHSPHPDHPDDNHHPPTPTTTTLGGCGADSAPPAVTFRHPAENDEVGGSVGIVVEALDPGPVSNGIREVRLSAEEQGGSRTAAIATLPGPGPEFSTSWKLPACVGPQDRWRINAEAVDGCGRSASASVRVKRKKDSCSAVSSSRPEAPALVWTSELDLPRARGQVIANGADVVFPGAGRFDLALPARPGHNRLEAVLVEGGQPGTWRFTLAGGTIQPGSLRVLAGEAVAVGPETVVFRLRGRPSERVVFAFERE